MPHSPLLPFSSWSGPRQPKILFVGEAWGESESISRLPFTGEAGKEFWLMLGEAIPDLEPTLHTSISEQHRYGLAWIRDREPWMAAAQISFTNVLNFRPPGNKIPELCSSKKEILDACPSYDYPPISKGKYLRPEYLPELDRLFREIGASRPNLIVALGNTATWALMRTTAIASIRGTAAQTVPPAPQVKVLPTYHPAGVLYNWPWRVIVIADLMKAFREAEFPEIRRPNRQVLINPTLREVQDWTASVLSNPPPFLGCDTETSLGMIDTIQFASSSSNAIAIPFGPHRRKRGNNFITTWPIRDGIKVASYWTEEEERLVWRLVIALLESPIPKVFQNGLYDLQYICRMGIRPNMDNSDDTMLHSHSLFPELPKGLGFLGSIYTNEASWKLMNRQKDDTEKRDE